MNKTLLVTIAAAVAAVGIWLGIQSRQAPDTLDPVVEPAVDPVAEPEPDVQLIEPEVIEEPAVTEDTTEEAPVTDDTLTEQQLDAEVAAEADEAVEGAVDGSVQATTPQVETMVEGIIEDDAAQTGDPAAVDDAANVAEEQLSPQAAEETADAVEEALDLQDLGLDISTDAIRAQIDAAGLNPADRGIIEGLLQAAGDNPELLEEVAARLRAITGN